MVAAIHGFLLGPQPNPPPTSQQQLLPPPPPPLASSTALYPYGMPHDDTAATTSPAPSVLPAGVPFQDVQATAPVPIHQPWMPPSPSPIPSYAMASTMGPVYTMASTPAATTTVAPAPTTRPFEFFF